MSEIRAHGIACHRDLSVFDVTFLDLCWQCLGDKRPVDLSRCCPAGIVGRLAVDPEAVFADWPSKEQAK